MDYGGRSVLAIKLRVDISTVKSTNCNNVQLDTLHKNCTGKDDVLYIM